MWWSMTPTKVDAQLAELGVALEAIAKLTAQTRRLDKKARLLATRGSLREAAALFRDIARMQRGGCDAWAAGAVASDCAAAYCECLAQRRGAAGRGVRKKGWRGSVATGGKRKR